MKLFVVILLLLLCTSCSSLFNKNTGTYGAASTKEDKALVKIQAVDNSLNNIDKQRLNIIGEFAYGVDLINTNKTVNILNERIQILANKPTLDQIAEIQCLVNELLNTNQTLLRLKDNEISNLQKQISNLNDDKETALANYVAVAHNNSLLSDQYKATISDLDSFWGLSAVFYGLKKLITRLAWTLGIFALVFFILRIASTSNPIAASLFNIFNIIGSWAVNIIKIIVPKALEVAGFVGQKVYNNTENTLRIVVDSIETAKIKGTGIEGAKEEANKTMDTINKEVINDLKKNLMYK